MHHCRVAGPVTAGSLEQQHPAWHPPHCSGTLGPRHDGRGLAAAAGAQLGLLSSALVFCTMRLTVYVTEARLYVVQQEQQQAAAGEEEQEAQALQPVWRVLRIDRTTAALVVAADPHPYTEPQLKRLLATLEAGVILALCHLPDTWNSQLVSARRHRVSAPVAHGVSGTAETAVCPRAPQATGPRAACAASARPTPSSAALDSSRGTTCCW